MKTKNIQQKILDVVIFVIIAILVVTTCFNFHNLFLEEPEYENCSKEYDKEAMTTNNLEQNNDGTVNANLNRDAVDKCYEEQSQIRQDYNQKTAWFKIIFALVISLAFVYIPTKNKLIYYALVTGALAGLVLVTIFSIGTINSKLYPIITILELGVIILIYTKLIKK